MNRTLILRLIAKDWYISRVPLVGVAVGGAAAVAMLVRGGTLGFAGILAALIALVFLSILVPITTIVNERKNQNLAFVMSLPISPMEYTTSKVLGNVSAFVVLWLAIAGTVLWMIASVPTAGGVIPFGIVVALVPFVMFSLLLCVAIVTESELLSMVTMGASNIAYSFWWMAIDRVPGLVDQMKGPDAVWSRPVLSIIGGEVTLIGLLIAATFYFQSRKRSFV